MQPIKRNHLLLPSKYEDKFESRALEKYQAKNRLRLNKNDFTIFSNSCVGGQIYKDLNLRFDSPFIGLYINPSDFLLFLSDPKYWINQPLIEKRTNIKYPVGLLGGRIRIIFRAYSTFDEALEKWNRRKTRINWDNIFVFFNPLCQDFGIEKGYKTHICETNIIESFLKLPYRNRVVLTNKKRLCLSSECVYMMRYSLFEYPPYIGIISCLSGRRIFDRYFDVVHWINTGQIKKRSFFSRL